MRYLAGFLGFWRDLLIGDDWTVAAGVIVALAVCAASTRAATWGWVWLPLAVAAILTWSLRRAVRASPAQR